MLSFVAHYKNKFPGARIEFSEENLNVYSSVGVLLIALSRGGGGVLVDQGKTLGALYSHCLSPIPKNTRVFKLTTENCIALDEKSAERAPVADKLVAAHGRVPSIAELEALGYEFNGESVIVPAVVDGEPAPAQA